MLLVCPELLNEFQEVLAIEVANKDFALVLDFSSAKKTYMDRLVPSIQDNFKPVEDTTKLCIVAFNIQDSRPHTLLELGRTLLQRPELLSVMPAISMSFEIPVDAIWQIEGHFSTPMLPSHQIQIR